MRIFGGSALQPVENGLLLSIFKLAKVPTNTPQLFQKLYGAKAVSYEFSEPTLGQIIQESGFAPDVPSVALTHFSDAFQTLYDNSLIGFVRPHFWSKYFSKPSVLAQFGEAAKEFGATCGDNIDPYLDQHFVKSLRANHPELEQAKVFLTMRGISYCSRRTSRNLKRPPIPRPPSNFA
jgi:hypothetical protein